MLGIVKEINGEKIIIPLTTDTGTGAPVGTLIQQYKKKPMSGYLYCDGSTFDQNAYPALYMYLGSNVLPDYRECVMVGAEENTTDTIATHDVYGEGEFKDDQLQDHKHPDGASGKYQVANGSFYTVPTISSSGYIIEGRTGDTTHGKQKAVYVYIKATSGLAENQQDNVLNATKDYVDNSNSYSTQEIKTGGTWIDGKPIYRKVVVESSDKGVQKNIDVSSLSIGTCVKLEGTCNGVAYKVPINTYRSDVTVFSLISIDGTNLACFAGGDLIGSTPIWNIIIEYTKTTD